MSMVGPTTAPPRPAQHTCLLAAAVCRFCRAGHSMGFVVGPPAGSMHGEPCGAGQLAHAVFAAARNQRPSLLPTRFRPALERYYGTPTRPNCALAGAHGTGERRSGTLIAKDSPVVAGGLLHVCVFSTISLGVSLIG